MKTFLRLFSLLFALQSASAQTQWTQRPSNTAVDLYGVAYGTSGFVAAGGGSGNISLTSSNGQTWNVFSNGGNPVPVGKITFANGTWVGTKIGQPYIYTSPDGHTWTRVYNDTSLPGGGYFSSVAYGNGVVVAVATNGQIRRSTDNGQTWSFGVSPSSQTLLDVTYGNGIFVAVGWGGVALISTDGLSWTSRTTSASYIFRGIAYGNGVFVAVGQSATTTSTDNGQSWNVQPFTTDINLSEVAYAGGTFVGVGNTGTIRTSPDAGQTWTLQASGVNFDLRDIAYGNGIWVAVGSNGCILTSPAGNNQPPLVPTVNISQAVKLDWQSQDGAVYQVQSSADMNTWQDKGLPFMGDGLPKTFYDGTASSAQKFYRIQIK